MVDLGSNTVKAGYAGEDTPKAVFPSAVGWLAKDQESAGGKDGGDVEMEEAGTTFHCPLHSCFRSAEEAGFVEALACVTRAPASVVRGVFETDDEVQSAVCHLWAVE